MDKERMCGYLGFQRKKDKFKKNEFKEIMERSPIHKSDFEEIKECQENILKSSKSIEETFRRILLSR